MHKKEKALKSQAAAVMAPWHGLFVLGKSLDAAYDAVEWIDSNPRILLTSSQPGRESSRLESTFRSAYAGSCEIR